MNIDALRKLAESWPHNTIDGGECSATHIKHDISRCHHCQIKASINQPTYDPQIPYWTHPQPTIMDENTSALADFALEQQAIHMHPSDGKCADCNGLCPVWFAPNELWNKVMPELAGILCPTCFIARAESKGIHPTGWELREESQPSEKGLTCPFCGEDDFDAVGLKAHFYRWCEKFDSIISPEQEAKERP